MQQTIYNENLSSLTFWFKKSMVFQGFRCRKSRFHPLYRKLKPQKPGPKKKDK